MTTEPPPTPVIASQLDALFSGTIFCDLIFAGVPNPEAGTEVFAESFALSPGGAANRAVAAARLGLRTALLAELGTDPLGNATREVLARESNLDLTWIGQRADIQSPVSVAMTGEQDRRFVTYAEEQPDLCWPATIPTVRLAHVNVGQPLPHWSAPLRERGTIFYGGVGWDETGAWSEEVLRRLSDVDVFVPNDVEAMNYTRASSPQDAARALSEYVPLAVVTCGPSGALAFDRASGELAEVPAIDVRSVDPTGAGDVFVAALMATHDRGWPLRERVALACLAASASVQSLGGARSAPGPTELLRLLADRQPSGEWAAVRMWLESLERDG